MAGVDPRVPTISSHGARLHQKLYDGPGTPAVPSGGERGGLRGVIQVSQGVGARGAARAGVVIRWQCEPVGV